MQPNINILVELKKRYKMYCLLISEYVVYLCRWACGQKFFCLRLHANKVNSQYNAKWPMSLFYVVKPLLTIIANSPLSQGGHIAPGDQKSFVLPR